MIPFMQQAGSDKHQRGRGAGGDLRRRRGDAGFVEQVDMVCAVKGAGKTMDLVKGAFLFQQRAEGSADAAGCADDDRSAAHGRTNRHWSALLSAASKR